jgi:hypothetical protein
MAEPQALQAPAAGRVATLAVAALLLLALLRGLLLLAHQPMIGLANNYDMIRVQGCIEAYPIRGDEPPWSNSWQAPIARYRFHDGLEVPCFPTSEALFAFAALPLLQAIAARSHDGGFPLQALGAIKLLALWLTVAAVSVALLRRGRPLAAAANALLAASLLFDPGVTVYLNSMYAEFAAVLFGYGSVAATTVALLDRRPSWWLLSLLALLVVLACTSKIQHVLFGAFLLGVLALVVLAGRRRPLRVLAAVALGAVLGAALQGQHMLSPLATSIRHANLTNTVLHAVLGSSSAPHATAQRLGLPASCGEHAGKNWFTESVQQAHPCPEVLGMSRLRLLVLVATEPRTVAVALGRGFDASRPWLSSYLGLVAGRHSAPLPERFFSWSRVLDRLPAAAWAVLLLAPPPLLGVWLLLRRRSVPPSPAPLLPLACCALYPWYALPVVVFGDGVGDVAKQFHLGTLAVLGFWHGLALLLAVVAIARWRAVHRAPAGAGVSAA